MNWLIPFVVCSLILHRSFSQEDSKLVLVQTLIRHGDRTPIKLYPKDPNPKSSWPEGLGNLTQLGKMQHYAVGSFLRSMYQDFITTNPKEVLVNSSGNERCLASAKANLAAFYAPDETVEVRESPSGKQRKSENGNGQPIPIYYLPEKQDKYLSYAGKCSRAQSEIKKQLKIVQMQDIFQNNKAQLKEISHYSGFDVTKGNHAYLLDDTLKIEREYGLIIPEWAQYYWQFIQEIGNAENTAFTRSPITLRLGIGPFLNYTSENMRKKINGDLPDLKVIMNFSHDTSILGVLKALNFKNMPNPPYAATLIFELYETCDGSATVRLLYLNSTDPDVNVGEPHVLELDGCSEFCPFEKFTQTFQEYIPEHYDKECRL